eukprot:4129058-Pleurochrysis_carterae.AAC.2
MATRSARAAPAAQLRREVMRDSRFLLLNVPSVPCCMQGDRACTDHGRKWAQSCSKLQTYM